MAHARKRRGFTLIELLVVIAIIGLLSTLAVVSLNSARQRSRDAKRLSDIKQLQTALELFYSENGSYPLSDVAAAGTILVSDDGNATGTGTVFSSLLATVPTAPTPPDGSCTVATNKYVYKAQNSDATPAECDSVADETGECKSYQVDFCIGKDTQGIVAGQHSSTPAGIGAFVASPW
ncbi:MAG TPA: type II secretion system protein [Patescibacteria group bacterium]|nr:type II secretion system protein [Patescibacteria group bacterium]